MKKLITLVLYTSLSTGVFAQKFTPKCEKAIELSVEFYKNKMEGVTDQGSVYLEYNHAGKELSYKLNLIGVKLGNSLLALDSNSDSPALLSQEFSSDKKLKGIDVLSFPSWRDFVFVAEEVVMNSCKDQYKIIDVAANESFTDIKLYLNNRNDLMEIEELKIKIPLVIIAK